jgi:hypothetical protein
MPRAIPATVARGLPSSIFLAYIIPTIMTIRFQVLTMGTEASLIYSWQTAHLCFPGIVFCVSKMVQISLSPSASTTVKGFDIPYILRTQALVSVLTGSAYLSLVMTIIRQYSVKVSAITLFQAIAPAASFSGCIAIWCTFTVWDLKRICAPGIGLTKDLLSILMISGVFGAPAALMFTWSQREKALQRGREKRVTPL